MSAHAAIAAPTSRPRAQPLTTGRFAELFESSSRVLWCIAVSILRERELARDIVQQSAIIALRKLHEFEPDTSFTAWMGQIVRYTALNEARRRSRRREGGDEGAIDQSPRASVRASQALSGPAFDEHITAALNDLDETARACLLMKVIAGLEYKDISVALGIPEGTAMSHVFRARKAMRASLAATHGPAAHESGPDVSARRDHP